MIAHSQAKILDPGQEGKKKPVGLSAKNSGATGFGLDADKLIS